MEVCIDATNCGKGGGGAVITVLVHWTGGGQIE